MVVTVDVISYSELFVESHHFNLPHLYLAPPLGVIPFEFCEIYGIRKLESLGYRVALFA